MSYRNTESILDEIRAERDRQDAKWGEQNHPLVHQRFASASLQAIYYSVPTAQAAREFCDREHKLRAGTYMSILVEEVCEAVEAACESEDAARKELVQVAAVAVAAIEAIDRRAKR